MAWVVSSEGQDSEDASSLAMPVPDGHIADDLLVFCITQDGGGTDIATTASGWAFVAGQATANGSHSAIAYKITAGGEATPTFTGANNQWAITKIIIRGADTTTPIHADNVAWASWTGATTDSPALTTTGTDTLLLYVFGSDQAWEMDVDNEQAVFIGREANACYQTVHWKNHSTASAVPTVTAKHETGTEGGRKAVIAITNVTDGPVKAEPKIEYNAIRKYGWPDSGTLSPLYAVTTTINSVSVLNATSANQFDIDTSEVTGSTANVVLGVVDTLPSSIDISGTLVSFVWRVTSTSLVAGSRFNGLGLFWGVVDSAGNWAIYQIKDIPEATETDYSYYVDIDAETVFEESGTAPDLTDIDRIIWGYQRGSSTSSAEFKFKNLSVDPKIILTGGNAARPASPGDLYAFERGGVKVQGANQVVAGENIQYGDGTIATYVDLSASAIDVHSESSEFNFEGTTALINRIIYASANCTMNFTNCVIASTVKTNFTIHASSNLSATYNFAGMNLSRHVVTWLTGVTCNKANFNQCYKIDAKAATFTNCLVSNSLDTVALTHTAAATITAMEFISGGTGHAIELTTAGDYTHTGVTYSGYAGSDGSTGNEAILVSASSGIVNITIGSADETPTIMTAGATVNLVQPQTATTIAVNVTGAEITILDTGTQTEQYHVETGSTTQDFDFTAPIGNNVDILVFKPGYRQFVLLDQDLGSADSTITANLVAVPSYA